MVFRDLTVSIINIDTKILKKTQSNQIKKCMKKSFTMINWNLFQSYKASLTLKNQLI